MEMKTFREKIKKGILNCMVYTGIAFLVGCQGSVTKRDLGGVSYELTKQNPYIRFTHNELENRDRLWLSEKRDSLYMDDGCDGAVDKIIREHIYNRGEEGTEKMFTKADKELEKAKRELGVE